MNKDDNEMFLKRFDIMTSFESEGNKTKHKGEEKVLFVFCSHIFPLVWYMLMLDVLCKTYDKIHGKYADTI